VRTENPFRTGDRVVFVGTKRHWVLTVPRTWNGGLKVVNPPFQGEVKCIWRKNSRHMVDVFFPLHGDFVCYPDELRFDVLDTLGAL
jgi:hypothetical protein